MDEWSPVGPLDIIYLDSQKAFDKVGGPTTSKNRRLIVKLKCQGMGISRYIINWIEQWLTGRRQRVGPILHV